MHTHIALNAQNIPKNLELGTNLERVYTNMFPNGGHLALAE